MIRLRRFSLEATPETVRELCRRSAVPDPELRRAAAEICEQVRSGGDAAMERLASTFGGGFRRVDPAEVAQARDRIDPRVTEALEKAASHIEAYARAHLPVDTTVTTVDGVEIDRRWTPLRRVAAYVPGGKAAYPSTVLMCAVPARVAGVEEMVVASPAGPEGEPSPVVLAACHLAGVDEVWLMGGAQAVAALAYGTESVRPVDKIVGPGNAWVTAAKLWVLGDCAIDMPAGPSEVLVLADHTADPRLVAVDLLCQAEHGPDSPAVLVTTDPELPDAVEQELARLLPDLDRADILEKALSDHGAVVIAPDREAAIAFANDYAAEHVTVLTSDPESDAKLVTSAGSVYVGRWSPESAGDYATGANHVLPTGGLAASYGPLSVEDFGSWRQQQRITREGLANIVDIIDSLATAEGLTAHRLAARIRFEGENQ
jgi:histidinol dehydrogenase